MIHKRECFANYARSVEIHLPTARGAWTSRGVKDWNHATEQLREHSQSKWHRDAIIHARMAEQGEQQSVLQLQCSAVLKQDEERRAKNRMIIMKLLHSVYILAKIVFLLQLHSMT